CGLIQTYEIKDWTTYPRHCLKMCITTCGDHFNLKVAMPHDFFFNTPNSQIVKFSDSTLWAEHKSV
ncbi:hypothetical protein, partial [Thiolapillus sp.]|uniref:hypothetical protein n=1 Tax=Thiolapillus sp. TaxID=2017437 RepID=UPI003AF5BC89